MMQSMPSAAQQMPCRQLPGGICRSCHCRPFSPLTDRFTPLASMQNHPPLLAMHMQVVGAAHSVGLRTTSTIMFGHVDSHPAWAHHLLALRALAARTGAVSEFVPLPFVHMEAPNYLQVCFRGYALGSGSRALPVHCMRFRHMRGPSHVCCMWAPTGRERCPTTTE